VAQTPLNVMEVNQHGRIFRVPHEDPEVLRYLGKCGLRPGAKVKLLSRTPYDQTMRFLIEDTGEEAVIGPALGSQITLIVEP